MADNAHERIMQLAIDVANMTDLDQKHALAVTASHLANEVEEGYVSADAEGELPTNAQGLALARFMRGRIEKGPVRVWAGGFSMLPAGYLSVSCSDGFEGGIARDGSTST
jgi:hypothetical protein